MKKPRVHVTDHAVLRYLERVQGLDVESLRCHIGRKVDRAVSLNASGVKVDGMLYCLRGQTVTTVIKSGKRRRG